MIQAQFSEEKRVKPRFLIPDLVVKVGGERVRVGNLSEDGALLYWNGELPSLSTLLQVSLKDIRGLEITMQAEVKRILPGCIGVKFLGITSSLRNYCNPQWLGSQMQLIQPGWWHGPNADLVVQYYKDGSIESIQLVFGTQYLEWSEQFGMTTGVVEGVQLLDRIETQQELMMISEDVETNDERKRLAFQVLNAVRELDPLVLVRFAG